MDLSHQERELADAKSALEADREAADCPNAPQRSWPSFLSLRFSLPSSQSWPLHLRPMSEEQD